MISQFFEVEIKEGFVDRYMSLAASLKPRLDAMGGCIFLDRSQSLSRKNLLLSYQIWQDEGSMTAWRADSTHHQVQTVGREEVFSDYRIRIAQVLHEARPDGSIWRSKERSSYNDPARRAPTYVLASESERPQLAVITSWGGDSFASKYREGRFVHLVDLPNFESGLELGPRLFTDTTTEYFRVFEIIRDYGMYDRQEAPQYYPPVQRHA